MDAFERVGIRGNELTTEHFVSGRRSLNLVQSVWTNRGINLWKVQLFTAPLVQNNEIYVVDPATVDVLDVYRRQTVGAGGGIGSFMIGVSSIGGGGGAVIPIDTMLYPIARNEYDAIPRKDEPGPPSCYWYERTLTPQFHLWPTPDGNGPYELRWHAMMRMTDADPTMGATGDMPFRFYPAFVTMLAADLAMKWAPERAQALSGLAQSLWLEASAQDSEHAPFHIRPILDAYFQ